MPKAKGMGGSLDIGRGQRRGIRGKGGIEKPTQNLLDVLNYFLDGKNTHSILR